MRSPKPLAATLVHMRRKLGFRHSGLEAVVALAAMLGWGDVTLLEDIRFGLCQARSEGTRAPGSGRVCHNHPPAAHRHTDFFMRILDRYVLRIFLINFFILLLIILILTLLIAGLHRCGAKAC